MNLPIIPADKANHAVYGAAIACAGAVVAGPLIGALLCVMAALGKEIYDRASGRGTTELPDVFWTLAGGALVIAPLALGSFA